MLLCFYIFVLIIGCNGDICKINFEEYDVFLIFSSIFLRYLFLFDLNVLFMERRLDRFIFFEFIIVLVLFCLLIL